MKENSQIAIILNRKKKRKRKGNSGRINERKKDIGNEIKK